MSLLRLGLDLGTTNITAVIWSEKTNSFEPVIMPELCDGKGVISAVSFKKGDKYFFGSKAESLIQAEGHRHNSDISFEFKKSFGENISPEEREEKKRITKNLILKILSEVMKERNEDQLDLVIGHPCAPLSENLKSVYQEIFGSLMNNVDVGEEKANELILNKYKESVVIVQVKYMWEPIAACVAMSPQINWEENWKKGDCLLVIDGGGGTLDMTLLQIVEGDNAQESKTQEGPLFVALKRIHSDGSSELGGGRIDEVLINKFDKHLIDHTQIAPQDNDFFCFARNRFVKKLKEIFCSYEGNKDLKEKIEKIQPIAKNHFFQAISKDFPLEGLETAINLFKEEFHSDEDIAFGEGIIEFKETLKKFFREFFDKACNKISSDNLEIKKILFCGGATKVRFIRQLAIDQFKPIIENTQSIPQEEQPFLVGEGCAFRCYINAHRSMVGLEKYSDIRAAWGIFSEDIGLQVGQECVPIFLAGDGIESGLHLQKSVFFPCAGDEIDPKFCMNKNGKLILLDSKQLKCSGPLQWEGPEDIISVTLTAYEAEEKLEYEIFTLDNNMKRSQELIKGTFENLKFYE